MICHICFRPPNSRRPFYCPTCARSQLYQLRVENAGVLLERSSIGQQIEDAVAKGTSQEESREPDKTLRLEEGASRRCALQAATTRQAESAARTRALNERVKSLRADIKNKQTDISQRKAVLSRRRSDAESAKYQLAEREAATLANIENNTKRTDHLWHSLHSKTAEARIFLCREAANLYGLRQKVVDKDKEGGPREIYMIGGVPIVDLREMSGKLPQPFFDYYEDINMDALHRCSANTHIHVPRQRCPPPRACLALFVSEAPGGNHTSSSEFSYGSNLCTFWVLYFDR